MPYSPCSPRCRKGSEEDSGKDGGRRCGSPVGYADERGVPIGSGKEPEITYRVLENVEAMRALAEDGAKASKEGTQLLLSVIIRVLTSHCAPK